MSVPRRDRVWIVVRAYDESASIRQVLTDLDALGCRALVVDDGSRDETAAIGKSLGAHVVRHPVNLGPGAALQTGIETALRLGAEVIVTFDGDGQHSPKDVEAVLAPILSGSADSVFGSRFLRAEDRRLVPFGRRLLLRGAALVNFALTGRRLTDAHNGVRALTRGVARTIELRQTSYAYASELLAAIVDGGWRLVEVPVTIRYDARARAKGQRGWNAINVLLDLLSGRSGR